MNTHQGAPPAGLEGSPLAGLRRLRAPRRPSPVGERCEMCAEPIGPEHRHVADLERRSVLCVCSGCYLLFTAPGAARGKYRAIPNRYRYQPSLRLTAERWEELGVPVRVAFIFFNSRLDRWVAFYPSPAGATEAPVSLDIWREVLEDNPAVADIEPDVEALLVRRNWSGFAGYLVPIDACYELAGLVKVHWKGFDGGEEAWRQIDEFFARLAVRGEVVSDG